MMMDDDDQQKQLQLPNSEDSEKVSEDGKVTNGQAQLSIKIKIPMSGKEENSCVYHDDEVVDEDGDDEDEDHEDDDDDSNMHQQPTGEGNNNKTKKDEVPRQCNECGRWFKSGKALGGHRRIHLKPNNNSLPSPEKNLIIDNKQYFHHHQSSDLSTPTNTTTTTTTTTICFVCGRSFKTEKSLFGHMRSHPDRSWRGVQPPSPSPSPPLPSNKKKKNNSSSSTVSDSVTPKILMDDLIDSAAATTTTISNNDASFLDLSHSLSGWLVTDKRGRKGTLHSNSASASATDSVSLPVNSVSAFDDYQKHKEGAENLMLLAEGPTRDDSLLSSGPSLTIEDTHQVSESVKKNKMVMDMSPMRHFLPAAKKLKIIERVSTIHDVTEVPLITMGKGKLKVEESAVFWQEEQPQQPLLLTSTEFPREHLHNFHHHHPQLEESESKGTDVNIPGDQLIQSFKINNKNLLMKKRKRRTLKLIDLEEAAAAEDVAHKHNNQPATPSRYTCITCNKSFPTHQALGGHRSSHNKYLKNNNNNNNTPPSAVVDESTYGYAPDHSTAAGDQNNEGIIAQVEVEPEECEEEEEGAGGSSSSRQWGTHQCIVCKKTFPTGQALGGHKRCHYTAPPPPPPPPPPPIEAPPPLSQVLVSSGEASQTGHRIPNFDLNELPAMEEEEEEEEGGGVESARLT